LGYVSYGYDAVVVVNFVFDEFVHAGVYDRGCCHFCDVEQPEVGIASCSVFGLPLRDEINSFHME
jgi:hypothetical protein